ncbi:N-acetylmuramoyl-L-alanine amidase family protein, partial [Clostridium neonatale]|uniref:N-acetylmuramoyl-L-alanine amidase family protein n=1 Tax=Clostridium neonatale TaxID=137838 RepID=UPI003D3577DB
MIKRLNKVTSLVVAAAAVASLVPATGAMAADYKRVESKDGTVYNAQAFKDGKFYIDGELEDKDEATYYVSNGKYTDLDDIDSGDTVELYGGKYLEVETGDYYLDLETGKVTDDEIREDTADDAATALRKKVKKDNDGRYDETVEQSLSDSDLKLISNKFQEEWYKAELKADSKSNGGQGTFTVYTDVKGNYIDADHNLGKINVITTGDSVALKNTEDKEKIKIDGKEVEISAVVTDGEVLGMDKDYIYRTAKLQILQYSKDGDKVTTSDATKLVSFGSKNNTIKPALTADGKVQIIQKISKAQASDEIDGAKYAKTVNTYFVTDDKGKTEDLFENSTINGGKVVGYEVAGGKLKAQTITLKSKNGYYYTDISDGDMDYDTDVKYSIDVDGNLWVLDGGYVKKYDLDEDFDKVYKVDGSMDELSVYDENNMILWNEDDEVYSIITGKAGTTEEDKEEETTTSTGWVQNADGTWNYL